MTHRGQHVSVWTNQVTVNTTSLLLFHFLFHDILWVTLRAKRKFSLLGGIKLEPPSLHHCMGLLREEAR